MRMRSDSSRGVDTRIIFCDRGRGTGVKMRSSGQDTFEVAVMMSEEELEVDGEPFEEEVVHVSSPNS